MLSLRDLIASAGSPGCQGHDFDPLVMTNIAMEAMAHRNI